MSNIPDETVKAVATALQEACKGQFGSYWGNDIAAHFARAALKAAGWAEMKEALEDLCRSGGPDDGGDVFERAYAALRKARGET